jgi:hypothetical protein
MPAPSDSHKVDAERIVDYDSGFDYRAFWGNRDYEGWVEARVLQRLLPRLGHAHWFADFGGGFGRNAPSYLAIAERAILVDYSVINLTRASEQLGPGIARGRVHLIRADLAHLPLVDAGVDAAMIVRVLHHFTDVEGCLTEMSRTVAGRWLVDVPIKHHILGRVRGAARGRYREVRGPEPIVTGSTEYPFRTFQLEAVRTCLASAGFRTEILASVNNFRRWDQVLPWVAVKGMRPLVYCLELAAQRLGRGWWGPSQFLVATRTVPQAAALAEAPSGIPAALADLARRLQCPACRGQLAWSETQAVCAECHRSYAREGAFWDFTLG